MTINNVRIAINMWLILTTMTSFSSRAEDVFTPADKQQINALFERWNVAFNHPDEAQSETLYTDQVEWYGQPMTAKQVITAEQMFMAKNKGYSQFIISQPIIQHIDNDGDKSDNNDLRVTFVKEVSLQSSQEMQDYPAEFLVRKLPQGWRIISETDGVTRYNQTEKADGELDYSVAKGKYDGKHISYVWSVTYDPQTGDECTEETDCNSFLWNSNPNIAPVKVTNHLINGVVTLSSLDNSGRDRIVVHTEWWMGAWTSLYLYDIQQSQWIRDISPISYNVNVEENLSDTDIIQPDQGNPGWVKVVSADMDAVVNDSDVQTKTTSEKLLFLQ